MADVQIDKTFNVGQGLHYAVYVYTKPDAASGPVTVQGQVWQGKRLVGVTPAHKLEDTPAGRKWSERIALDGFPPGDYELRVVATDPGTVQKAERRVTFRVEA